MGKFDDFFKRRQKDEQKYEYYEDSHNEYGELISKPPFRNQSAFSQNNNVSGYDSFNVQKQTENVGFLPKPDGMISARQYQNVVVYEPKSPDDVQMLIDYLKRREPAIINLDGIDPNDAQRVLDFVSGAIYALNGSIHRVASNIFLLSPEGVEITVPYDPTV